MTNEALRKVGRELGRAHRSNQHSRIYMWLDAMDPPRTLSWLARKVGRSRQSLATYIQGSRRVRMASGSYRNVLSPVPKEVVAAVEALSLETDHRVLRLIGGPITVRDWPCIQ